MLNKVTLMGRLTKDPMVKYSQGGTAIARYTGQEKMENR